VDTLPLLRQRLPTYAAREAVADRRAAVAAVLRPAPGAGDELLFIQRAEHPLDPWSGHMALPGGMLDPEDANALAAARRETREELGLDLERAGRLLGRLSDVAPRTLHRSLAISPFVFELDPGEVALTINEEVQAALWIPLAFLADAANRSTFFWSRGGAPVPFPCYRWGEGRVIWGLTLRIVDELLGLLGDPSRAASRPR
jgi:8-oxo-dGTP pyrophosphatase MutT (NUDIX family)